MNAAPVVIQSAYVPRGLSVALAVTAARAIRAEQRQQELVRFVRTSS